jgi:hypothetical protein
MTFRDRVARLRRFASSRAGRRGGLTAVEASISIAVGAAAALTIGMATMYGYQAVNVENGRKSDFAAAEAFRAHLTALASSSVYVGTPTTDVDGFANCDANGHCREVDLMERVAYADHTEARFHAYRVEATGIQAYEFDDTVVGGPDLNVRAVGTKIPSYTSSYFRQVPVTATAPGVNDPDVPESVRSFTARMVAVSQGRGDTPVWSPKRIAVQTSHPGVTETNDAVVVHYAYSVMTLRFPIMTTVHAQPGSAKTFVTGYYTPSPAPTLTHTTSGSDGGSGELDFPYPGAAAKTFAEHEYNYHDAMSVSGPCAPQGDTPGSTTVASTSANNGGYMAGGGVYNVDPTGDATFTVSPLAAGLCSQSISTVYRQIAAETILVASALAPASSSVAIGVAGSGQPQTATVSLGKTYHYAPINLTFDGGCAGIATAAEGDPGTGTRSSALQAVTVTVTAIASGACTITAIDQYGEASAITVNSAAVPPSLKPNMLVCSSQPRGTDLGPDVDGVHEDVSNGTPCPVGGMITINQTTTNGATAQCQTTLVNGDGSTSNGANVTYFTSVTWTNTFTDPSGSQVLQTTMTQSNSCGVSPYGISSEIIVYPDDTQYGYSNIPNNNTDAAIYSDLTAILAGSTADNCAAAIGGAGGGTSSNQDVADCIGAINQLAGTYPSSAQPDPALYYY